MIIYLLIFASFPVLVLGVTSFVGVTFIELALLPMLPPPLLPVLTPLVVEGLMFELSYSFLLRGVSLSLPFSTAQR